jgi:phospholipase/carboxylesterase
MSGDRIIGGSSADGSKALIGFDPSDPHANQPIHLLGSAPEHAIGAVIMLHGRGSSAPDILNLAQAMFQPKLAYLAPSAANNTWYPHTFLSPREENEPWLSSATKKVQSTIQLANDAGIATDRIMICGFSQGACLTSEYAATHPARYAGLMIFTGGVIGPLGMELHYPGDLLGTPAFLGSGDRDPHIPWPRVQQTADVLSSMNAQVTLRCYPGRPHTVGGEEIQFGRKMIAETFQ